MKGYICISDAPCFPHRSGVCCFNRYICEMKLTILLAILTLASCKKCYQCTEETTNHNSGQVNTEYFEVCATTQRQIRQVHEEGNHSIKGVYSTVTICKPIE